MKSSLGLKRHAQTHSSQPSNPTSLPLLSVTTSISNSSTLTHLTPFHLSTSLSDLTILSLLRFLLSLITMIYISTFFTEKEYVKSTSLQFNKKNGVEMSKLEKEEEILEGTNETKRASVARDARQDMSVAH